MPSLLQFTKEDRASAGKCTFPFTFTADSFDAWLDCDYTRSQGH